MTERRGSKKKDKTASIVEEEKPEEEEFKAQPRRKTVMLLMAQGERAEKKEMILAKQHEDEQPLCKLVPMPIALKLRTIVFALAKDIPESPGEFRMARLRAPKSSTAAFLKGGATADQAATHASLKALEAWVKLLKPFASNSEKLAWLIAKIVHVEEDDDGHWEDADEEMLQVVPPPDCPLGAALRRLVPEPDDLVFGGGFDKWDWLEDLWELSTYSDSFDLTSIVHRPSTSKLGKAGESMVSTGPRPTTTGRMPAKRPKSGAARMRLSGPLVWNSFQKSDGFRATTTSFASERYQRTIPGPAVYSDYDKTLAKPQTAARGVFPSCGDKRTPCITTSLTYLDRFFHEDFKVDR